MDQKSDEAGWWGFLELVSKLRSTEELNNFFELFLTLDEQKTLSSRYIIIKALLEGHLTQREIAKIYKVSIAQITRGSNAIKVIGPKLKKFLK